MSRIFFLGMIFNIAKGRAEHTIKDFRPDYSQMIKEHMKIHDVLTCLVSM